MDSVIFLGFAAAYLLLLAWGVTLVMRRGRVIASDLALLVILGLVYDNAVIGFGVTLGEGPLLETLNAARYWLHGILTPLLILVAWHVLVRAGVRWARSGWALATAAVLTVACGAYEMVVGAVPMRLEPEVAYGALDYANVNAPDGPPLMVLVVAAALLVAGILVWVRMRWPWLAVATAVLVVGSAVPLPVPSAAATNAFELILLIGVLATIAFQDRRAVHRGERR